MPGSKVDDFALSLPDKAFTVLLRGSEGYMPLEKVNLLLSERSYVNSYPVHNLNAHVESAANSDNVSAYTMLPISPYYFIKLNRQYGRSASRRRAVYAVLYDVARNFFTKYICLQS